MEASLQELLQKAWLSGRTGSMCALQQARAWALREVWRDDDKSEYGMYEYIAGKVEKVGGGHPGGDAIMKFFQRVDEDPRWFPGKSAQQRRGPASAITPTNQAVVARSAMAMKERGQEPTYASLVAACPQALTNPTTQEVVGKKRVYAILEERCYDDPENPDDTWEHNSRYSKVALTETAKRQRFDWGLHEQGRNRQPAWLYKNVVWTDICNTILARTEKRHLEMTLARKGKKGWGSKGSKLCSKNLRGKPESLKQRSWDTVRVWWAPVLSRGKLHLEVLGDDFPGETPEGAATLVAKVRAAVNVRFQSSDQPRILFTDRGQGFYNIKGGRITTAYKEALSEHSLKAYYGDNASVQPGNLQEVLLHETAVAWVRRREAVSQPLRPWKETPAEYAARLRSICQYINANFDVEGLCRKFPERLQLVVDAEGDRIKP